MAVITLTAGSGAPGVTTTVMAMALMWPRPVLVVEADPSGAAAISAGWFQGRPPHDRGLLNLAMAHRQGQLGEAIRDVVLPVHGSTAQIIAGTRSPAQATSVAPLWESLAAVLRGMEAIGTDVLVDAGRLGLVGSPMPILRASDAVLLLTRTSLPAISGARGWAAALREDLLTHGQDRTLGLLIVGEGRPYTTREVARSLQLPAVARLAWDPDAAETFSSGKKAGSGAARSALARSIRAAISAVSGFITNDRARLQPGNLVSTET